MQEMERMQGMERTVASQEQAKEEEVDKEKSKRENYNIVAQLNRVWMPKNLPVQSLPVYTNTNTGVYWHLLYYSLVYCIPHSLLHSSSVLAFFFKPSWARYAFTATASGLRDSYLTNSPSSFTN